MYVFVPLFLITHDLETKRSPVWCVNVCVILTPLVLRSTTVTIFVPPPDTDDLVLLTGVIVEFADT